jgi:hypothetical protein
VEVKITPETFANAITGLAAQDCEFETHNLLRLGSKREHKTEIIPQPKLSKGSEAYERELDTILKPFEKHGWTATRDDAANYHRYCGDKVKVGFVRYVKS